MSIIKTLTVACDFPGCDDTTDDGGTTNGEARNYAFLSGWGLRAGRDYCPTHIDPDDPS